MSIAPETHHDTWLNASPVSLEADRLDHEFQLLCQRYKGIADIDGDPVGGTNRVECSVTLRLAFECEPGEMREAFREALEQRVAQVKVTT